MNIILYNIDINSIIGNIIPTNKTNNLIYLAQTESQEMVDHKWNRLEALSEMLSSMSKEYKEIAQQLQVSTPAFWLLGVSILT